MNEERIDPLAAARGIINGLIISLIIIWIPACIIAAIIWELM